MKKTVTTMLSLALALILVSSLSSGVILAKGDDDHDNRKKNKNKYETVRDVAILDCGFDDFAVLPPGTLVVTAFHHNTDDAFDITPVGPPNGPPPTPTECVEAISIILKARFTMQNSSGGFHPVLGEFLPGSDALYSRYTFLRTRKVRRED